MDYELIHTGGHTRSNETYEALRTRALVANEALGVLILGLTRNFRLWSPLSSCSLVVDGRPPSLAIRPVYPIQPEVDGC